MILEEKDLIFGKFSQALDNRKKHSIWTKIHEKGVNIGLFHKGSTVEKVKSLWQTERSAYLVSSFFHFFKIVIVCNESDVNVGIINLIIIVIT